MTDLNEVSVSDAMSSMEPADWEGWTIDIRESYPFHRLDLSGTNEEESLEAYRSGVEAAVRREFPGADFYYTTLPPEPDALRILIIGPVMVEKDGSNATAVMLAEEKVRAGVQDVMEGVWSEGAFWVPA